MAEENSTKSSGLEQAVEDLQEALLQEGQSMTRKGQVLLDLLLRDTSALPPRGSNGSTDRG